MTRKKSPKQPRKNVALLPTLSTIQRASGEKRQQRIQAILTRTRAGKKHFAELTRGADVSDLRGLRVMAKTGPGRPKASWRNATADRYTENGATALVTDPANAASPTPPPPMPPPVPKEERHAANETLAMVEWRHIQEMLAACDGNLSWTARRLGIERSTLQRKLARMTSAATPVAAAVGS